MAIVEGVHVLVGAGFCSIFRAINVGLTQEWGAQRLVYCIDSPFWQTSCASKLAQQGELNHGLSLAFLAPSGSALDVGRLHTVCSTLVVTMFMSSTCSADILTISQRR